ncbi:MAG: hypothetical protein HC912_07465 [Saprospiraceae bacterium]|nr:hypothetical protein [Saprospiraceae bacterium]
MQTPIAITKAEFLKLAEARYDELAALSSSPDFFTYEKNFEEIWLDLGREVLEGNISKLPENHKKKVKFSQGLVK